MTTLLDTCIVIALTKPGDKFHEWAVQQLKQVKRDNPPAAICDTSFAEASAAYNNADELNVVLAEFGIDRLQASDDALYAAGQAYKAYRRRGGTRDGVLPDFIIGAVAHVEKISLMTSNGKDFVKCFTELSLVEPPKTPA